MSIEIGTKIVTPLGVTLFEADSLGLKDASSRYLSFYQERTFPLLAASVDSFIWTCIDGVWVLEAAVTAHTVVGGSGATVQLVHCASSVAIASGTAQLSAAIDLTVTAPAEQYGTLIASPTQFLRGDSLGIDMSGTLTGLVGVLTYRMKRIG